MELWVVTENYTRGRLLIILDEFFDLVNKICGEGGIMQFSYISNFIFHGLTYIVHWQLRGRSIMLWQWSLLMNLVLRGSVRTSRSIIFKTKFVFTSAAVFKILLSVEVLSSVLWTHLSQKVIVVFVVSVYDCIQYMCEWTWLLYYVKEERLAPYSHINEILKWVTSGS